MIRFISFMLGKPYETCKSCETLKEQLSFERDEKKRLTDTLLEIMRPKVVEAAPIEVNQIQQSSAIFSRRRAAMEERDRQQARILQEAKHLGKPDALKNVKVNTEENKEIEQLEKELDIPDEQKEA